MRNPVQIIAGDDVTFYNGRLRFMERIGDDGPLEPEDLTEWSNWKAQWRPYPKSDTVLELELDDTDAADGYLTISADAATTRAMGRSGVWDVQATKDGKVRTFYSETTEWKDDVTRD